MSESAIRVRTGGHKVLNEAVQTIGLEKCYRWTTYPEDGIRSTAAVGYCFYDDDGHIRDMFEDWSERDPQIPKSIWWHTGADFVGFRVVRPLRKVTKADAARYGLDKVQQADLEDDLSRR